MNYLQDIYFSNLNMIHNTGGYFAIGKNYNWACENVRFDQCKFYFITEGNCVINIDGVRYEAGAGDWFFIPAHTLHSYHNINTKPFKKYWMHFDLYPDSSLFKSLDLPYMIKMPTVGRVKNLFSLYAKNAKSDKLVDRLTVKSCLISLLCEYIKAGQSGDSFVGSKEDARLEHLLRYINENLDKELDNQMLAKMYLTHPNHFIRAFCDKVGQTPARYIRQKRLEAAKRMLEKTELSFGEVSERVGLGDVAHFSKCFKAYYNMTPTECRKYFKKHKYR